MNITPVLSNGIWITELFSVPDGIIEEGMKSLGYHLYMQVGSADSYKTKVWWNTESRNLPYIIDGYFVSGWLTIGATSFGDMLSVIEKVSALVYNGMMIDTVDELMNGRAELEEVLAHIRANQTKS